MKQKNVKLTEEIIQNQNVFHLFIFIVSIIFIIIFDKLKFPQHYYLER